MLWYIYVYDRYEPRFVAQQDAKSIALSYTAVDYTNQPTCTEDD